MSNLNIVNIFVVTVVSLTLLFAMSFYSNSFAQLECTIEQITNEADGDSMEPIISDDGMRIAFETDADINGSNPEENLEIYVFDISTRLFTQITDEPAGFSELHSINSDGTLIAFGSNTDINGGNSEGNFEVFLFDTDTMSFTQVTDETEGDSSQPYISSDGTKVVFRSSADIDGGNPEGNTELYLYDISTETINPITDEDEGSSLSATLDSDGTLIPFHTFSDIDGGNPENNPEIYLFDTTTSMFTQITDESDGGSAGPSIDLKGTRIAFRSSADIDGGNPEGNLEIYLYDTTSGIITQLTDEVSGDSRSFADAFSADGTRLVFDSSANINGGNPEGNTEMYLFDSDTELFTQITDVAAGDSFIGTINSAGTLITFESDADLTGDNPEGNSEVFLADCRGIHEPGDANGDGVINILDITVTVNGVLQLATPQGNADCNEDGQVNILDITCVVNKVLSGE